MPSLHMPVQRLKVAILPLDLPCSGPVTCSGENLTTGKSHGLPRVMKYYSPIGRRNHGRPFKRLLDETGTGQQVAQLHERYDVDDLSITGRGVFF